MACGNVRNLGGLAAGTLNPLRPLQLNQPLTALIIGSELLNYGHQIVVHRITMAKEKTPKHASKMTNAELAEAVFHPRVLRHVRKHIERLNAEAEKPKKSRKKAI
jgi:hypothetical protein